MIADLLLDPSARPVIGHRGASGLAPENTIAAFDLALEQGADGLEFDVRLTADGVPVVHHDATLTRTTGLPGVVSALSLAQVLAADAGATFCSPAGETPYWAKGIRVPTLEEVLDRYRTVPLLLEIKVAAAAPAVREQLVRAGATDRVVVASFSDAALAPLRGGNILVGAARRDILRHFALSYIGGPWAPPAPLCYAVPYRYKGRIEVPTGRFIAAAHRHGRPVHVWTVDDPGLAAALWSRGANGLVTNFPARLAALRRPKP